MVFWKYPIPQESVLTPGASFDGLVPQFREDLDALFGTPILNSKGKGDDSPSTKVDSLASLSRVLQS